MRISSLFASTVLAAGLAVMTAGAASAAPILFTWDPSATANGTLSSASPQSPKFSANNMTVADYATINLSNLSNVTETGILAVTNVTGGSFAFGLVNGTGSGLGILATPYQLYFQFSSTSSVAPNGSGGLTGVFTSLSYTLYGDIGGTCHFSTSGVSGCSGSQLVLATGSLSSQGLNSVNINAGGIPSANVNVDVVLGADAGGFFVNPSDLTNFNFETAFTNTPGVVSQNGPIITIDGGGGNVDLIKVPEPITLSVFGAGLVGAAALRRRKAKKA
jgi:hypothetical protein